MLLASGHMQLYMLLSVCYDLFDAACCCRDFDASNRQLLQQSFKRFHCHETAAWQELTGCNICRAISAWCAEQVALLLRSCQIQHHDIHRYDLQRSDVSVMRASRKSH